MKIMKLCIIIAKLKTKKYITKKYICILDSVTVNNSAESKDMTYKKSLHLVTHI